MQLLLWESMVTTAGILTSIIHMLPYAELGSFITPFHITTVLASSTESPPVACR